MHSVFLFLYLSFFTFLSHAGFASDTLVFTQQNLTSLEQLPKNSSIISYDCIKNCVIDGTINQYHTYTSSNVYKVICDYDISFIAASDQVVRVNNSWWVVKDLKVGDRLWCYDLSRHSSKTTAGSTYLVVQDIKIIPQETELIEITVLPAHTFFVTSAQILVHNHPVIMITAVPLVTSIIPAAAKAIVVLASVGAALYSLFAKSAKSNINRSSINNSSSYSTPSLPPEDPEDEKNFYEKIKHKADKIARTKRFGKLYRDPETKLWWSKDNAHHGGSRYKVFKEGNRGFEWKFDGDGMGKVIENKHKGPIGRFISYTEVIFLK